MRSITHKILKESTEEKTNPLYLDKNVIVKPAGEKGNGLFARIDIKRGEIILLAKIKLMSDEDWNIVKDTEPVKLFGFRWDDEHGIPLGEWKFDFTNIKDRILWKKTEFFKKYCNGSLRLSGFLFVNDIDIDTMANVEEYFDIPNNIIGIKAIKDISAGDEIIKEYNYDWREEFKSWRSGILEGLNLIKDTPESWFKSLLNQMTQTSPNGDGAIYFDIKRELYMELIPNVAGAGDDYILINYDKIWSVLEERFDLNFKQIEDLIASFVGNYTNYKHLQVLQMDEFRDAEQMHLPEGLNLIKKTTLKYGDPIEIVGDYPKHMTYSLNRPWSFDHYFESGNKAVIKYQDVDASGSSPIDVKYIRKKEIN